MLRALTLLAVALLLAGGATAHKPDDDDYAKALVTTASIAVDGELDEDDWEDLAEDEEVKFSSPNDAKTVVWFLWDPEDERLYVALNVSDETPTASDYVEFAFAADHDDTTADDDDQSILRAYRNGDLESVSVEDNDDVLASSAPTGVSADVVDYTTAGYVVEIRVEWDDTHAGWAVRQNDGSDDDAYPTGAHLEKPTTWADVKGEKIALDVSLAADKSTGKVGETVKLTAEIDDYQDLVDFDKKISFERWNGASWVSLGSKTPDADDGDAELTYTFAEPGANRFRARTPATDVYAESVSPEVSILVADVYTKIHGDASTMIRHKPDPAGWRTYALLANASSGLAPTWEASTDGAEWHRLATGASGSALETIWTPPDGGRWLVRVVEYAADGASTVGTQQELPAYALPSAKTATTVALAAEEDAPGATLRATVAPAASGTVAFFRAPDTLLGTATLSGGAASLELDEVLPGQQTYVARYEGSSAHAPSAARATAMWWPDDPASYGPRWLDAEGDDVEVAAADVRLAEQTVVEVHARRGAGPGVAGMLDLRVRTPSGETDVVYRGAATSGALEAAYTPEVAGEHVVEARFYRASGNDVLLDVRNATFDVGRLLVNVTLEVPTDLRAGERAVLRAALDPLPADGTVKLKLGDATLETATVDDEGARFEWTPPAGAHALRAEYSGDDRHEPAVSDEVAVDVAEASTGDDGDGGAVPGATEGGSETPVAVWVALAAVGAAAALLRRR